MIYALISFLIVLFGTSYLHNHGLWLAFMVFSLGRSIFSAMYVPRLNKKVLQLQQSSSSANTAL